MSNFESDNLLLKSQMLISRFRKQREVSLDQNILCGNKPTVTYLPHKRRDLCLNNNNNSMKIDYDSYPHRTDYVSLNEFMNQHLSKQANEDLSKSPIDCGQNLSENVIFSSDSDDSVWSASHNEKENKFVDFGIMTDCVLDNFIDNDEIITPITTLPPIFRAKSESNMLQTLRLGFPKNHNKIFSSICTQFMASNSNKENISKNVRGPNIIFDEYESKVLDDTSLLQSNEEDKIKVAWEYFQEEKNLEKQIFNQKEILKCLGKDLDELKTKMENEFMKLNGMTNEKEKFKIRRYEIFNGLSKEIQLNINVRDEHMNYTNSQQNIVSTDYINELKSDGSEMANDIALVSLLDNNTVRKIVNKIVAKEFCNSDGLIFNKIFTIPLTKYSKDELKATVTHQFDDDCVLSDILSIKDLKIQSSPFENEAGKIMLTSSIPILNNLKERNNQRPLKLKKKQKITQSADNINQLDAHSKFNRVTNIRIPSISADLKRCFNSSSSSDESIFESSILTRH